VKTPTRDEFREFVKHDDWDEDRATGHDFFEKTLPDGEILGGLILKVRDSWPRTSRVFCARVEDGWPPDAEVLEEVSVTL